MQLGDAFPPGILECLSTWYDAHVPGHVGPFRGGRIATAGRSNVTVVLTDSAGNSTVVRRPPVGNHLPTAHDVCREGRIMQALAGSGVPVPPVAAVCDDPAVIGAPFFAMRFVDGAVIDTVADAAPLTGEERKRVSLELAHHLATLHRVDPEAVGLGSFARRDGFVERQLRRFAEQWRGADGSPDTASFSECTAALQARRPAECATARIVHGDYRLGNVIVRQGSVVAVLDWELTTLGHPLSDLAYLLNNWVGADEASDGPITSPIAAGGFASREEIVAAYLQAGGEVADTDSVDFFRAFSYWRLASIRSGVVSRLERSSDHADRDRAEQSRASIPKLLAAARGVLDGTAHEQVQHPRQESGARSHAV